MRRTLQPRLLARTCRAGALARLIQTFAVTIAIGLAADRIKVRRMRTPVCPRRQDPHRMDRKECATLPAIFALTYGLTLGATVGLIVSTRGAMLIVGKRRKPWASAAEIGKADDKTIATLNAGRATIRSSLDCEA